MNFSGVRLQAEMQAPPGWRVVTCAVLEQELMSWPGRFAYGVEFVFLPSNLDLSFSHLERALDRTLKQLQGNGPADCVLVLYGQCHPDIQKIVTRGGARLLSLGNCYELLLGKEKYREHLAAGTYFVLPQWASYWDKIFTRKLGFTPELGGIFFPEMHRQAVYLDTGFVYRSRFDLSAFEKFTRLPVMIQKVDLGELYVRLDACFANLATEDVVHTF